MGAHKYNAGAQITQTIFGISRDQVTAAAAVGALIIAIPRLSRPGKTGRARSRE